MVEFLGGKKPVTGEALFIADSAEINGDVEFAQDVSIWSGVVIRADINILRIGKMTNIQEGVIIHVDIDTPTHIGERVTIGHGAILHGCVVRDSCLIGIGAIILDGAEIGDHTIIAAGSLVPPGKKIPPNSMVMGSPGKVVRQLTEDEVLGLERHAENYVKLAKAHRELTERTLRNPVSE